MINDDRVKRLLYQSIHRGCKETDAILGKFAKRYLHEFNELEIDLYEKFISEDDWDIYAWLVGNKELPDSHKNKITDMLLNYDFVNDE